MSEIIANKKIVISAEDRVTSVIAKTNQAFNQLEQHLSQLGMKFNSGASEQSSYKTALNSTKSTVGETDEAIRKLNHNIDRLSKSIGALSNKVPVIKPRADTSEAQRNVNKLTGATKKAGKAGHSLTKSFTFGSLISNGIQDATNSLIGFAKQGFSAALAGQQVAARWSELGMTTGQIKEAGAAVADLKENTNMSGTAVANLVTRFYGLTGSEAEAVALSKGVGSITDSLRLSRSASDAFANGLTRIESAGKVTRQSLGRLERQAPGITAALQRASGMSKKSFDDLLDSGKMSVDQFNQIMVRASKSYRENADSWDHTTEGALNNIKRTWAVSWQTMMAPLSQNSGQGLNALSKSLQTLQPQFKQLGEAVAELATKFAKWLTPQHAKDLGEIVGSLGRMAVVLGKGAWNAVTKPLQLIGKAINAMSGKKGDALDDVATALDHISKNKIAMDVLETIGALLTTQFAYSKMLKIAKGLGLVKDVLTDGKLADGMKLFGKWHISGNIFKDVGKLTKKLTGLKNLKINPANWFKGKKFSFKNLFKGAPKDATTAGDKAGGSFVARMLSKIKGVKFEGIGSDLGSKLGGAFALAFGAIDLFKALSAKKDRAAKVGKSLGETAGGMGGAAIGASLGSVVPGIGTLIGGLLGGLIGSKAGGMIGQAIGKCWGTIKKGAVAVGKFLLNALTAPFKAAFKVGEWFGSKVKELLHHESGKSSSQPSSDKIKSLGGNHYSKSDIANVKAMNSAITSYTRSLEKLKQVIKHDDPTKQLNSMNKRLSTFVKQLQKETKPLSRVAKDFNTFGKSTKLMSTSIKSLTGKHGLGEFDKDLDKLGKDMKHTKIGSYFEKLAKSIRKSKLADEFKSLTKYLGSMVKGWKNLVKPLNNAGKAFQSFEKVIRKLSSKKTGLSKVDTDLKTLSKDLNKYNFGKTLYKQMQEANKAVGRRGFVKEFNAMVRSVEADLRSFNKTFSHDWGLAWENLNQDVSRALGRAEDAESHGFSSLRSTEDHFESGFKKSWNDWLDDIVSAFKSGFDKLPSFASKSMSDIVSRLNKGISGINSVIGDFGGDKKLDTISYAHGTLVHPGGKAIVNDGLTPNKTELIYQPSKGWGTAQGQNVVRDLEAGSMVVDAPHSAPVISKINSMIPHYADGTLSDDEQDKISQEFIANPVQASKDLVLKLTNWDSSVPAVADLGKATAIGFSRGIANVLKDLLGIIKEPINGDWTPVIKSAARLLHFDIAGWQIAKLLRQIQTESGGREVITNNWDSNAAAGHPSQGLLQFVPSTFNTWAVGKYTDINKGFDQILAAINALNHGGEGGWGNIGNGHGWATGGEITSQQFGWVGDNAQHHEFVINPYNSNSLPLLAKAWKVMNANHPEWRTTTGSSYNATMIALMKAAVASINNIDIHPRVYVDDVRRPINNRDAMDYSRVMN